MINTIRDLLRSDGSIVVNKNLVHILGLNAAIMYSELVSKHAYFEDRGQLTEDGFFFNTVDNMRLDTGLGEKPQATAIKTLIGLELIKVEKRGLPAKRYFKVIEDASQLETLLNVGSKNKDILKSDLETRNKKKKESHPSNDNSSAKREELRTSQKEELVQPNGRLNNTKRNNTKKNNNYKGTQQVGALPFANYYNKFSIDLGTKEVVEYYLATYQDYRGEKHPNLKAKQWSYVVDNLFYVRDFDLSETDLIDMIEKHFETDYQEGCDYNILHFMSDEVRLNRMYEVAY
jgi:hypothetical protein